MMGFRLVEEKVFSKGYTAVNLTGLIEDVVARSRLREGIVTIYSPEPRVVILLIEYEPSLLRDLEEFISKYSDRYERVIDALLGKSVSVPVVDGDLDLGVFKHIVLVDLSHVEGSKKVIIGLEGLFEEN